MCSSDLPTPETDDVLVFFRNLLATDELARAWPGAELIIVDDSGHTGSTTMSDQMHAAADRLYEQITSPA